MMGRFMPAGDPMATDQPRGPKQIFAAFLWSMKGFRAAFRYEASFRLEAYIAIVVVPLALWLGHGGVEKFLLLLGPALVLSAELLNSGIEAVVDKVSPEFHELAGRAKDMGSAAVFVCLMLTAASWLLIALPHWL
jgi:diacylglycerol kinase (ATP)